MTIAKPIHIRFNLAFKVSIDPLKTGSKTAVLPVVFVVVAYRSTKMQLE
jgi:hypothetical protein